MEKDDFINTEIQDFAEEIGLTGTEANELCQTCGKWVIHDDNQCYGCKRPVEDCCC